MAEKTHTGSCLCGGVTFTLTPPLRPAIACHCTQCRKTSGHYWSATSVARNNLTLTRTNSLTWFDSSAFARRGFCNRCGASLFCERPATGNIAIGAGCLDAPTGLTETRHIFCADKGDYYTLPDGPAHIARRDADAPALPEDRR